MSVLCILVAMVSCSDDTKRPPSVPDQHRPNNLQCTEPAPQGNISCSGDCPTGSNFECTSDSDCAATGLNGRCVNGGGPAGSYCTHDSCTVDTDCPSGETCACHGSPYTDRAGSACVPGNCRVDADCPPGGNCSPSAASTCRNATDVCLGYYCHTPKDLCINDSDCASHQFPSACIYSTSTGYWACASYGGLPY